MLSKPATDGESTVVALYLPSFVELGKNCSRMSIHELRTQFRKSTAIIAGKRKCRTECLIGTTSGECISGKLSYRLDVLDG